jgi:energy-coupling factor transporter ATP-binding protein EcfA2
MSARDLLQAHAAAFQYPAGSSPVGPFDLSARGGELHLFTGSSGCGKSTLARLLTGVIPHLYRGRMHGRVVIGGRRSTELPLWQIAERIGFLSQNPAAQLLASTVRDEILFGLENLGLPPAATEARVEAALDDFALRDLAARDPVTLSGGEQQRLLVAAIAARQPDAIVLDEPLSMLDGAATRRLVDHLERLRRRGTAVLVFEHRLAAFAGLRDVVRHALPGLTPVPTALPAPPAQLSPFGLAVEDLAVERGGRLLLDGVNLALADGQVLAVVGDNGAGKTMLLRALAGLEPHRGRITGHVRGGSTPPRLGLCFQNPDCQLFNPSVRTEILCGTAAGDAGRYDAVVRLLGLAAYEDTPPLLLSEGEKKRLGLAIMLMRPEICGVCLDEPTLGQDAYGCRLLGRILRHLAAAGYLCVVATHDLDWAAEWSDAVVVLAGGRVRASGPPRLLRTLGHPARVPLGRPDPVEGVTCRG